MLMSSTKKHKGNRKKKKRVITGMMTASVIVSLAGCGAGQKLQLQLDP